MFSRAKCRVLDFSVGLIVLNSKLEVGFTLTWGSRMRSLSLREDLQVRKQPVVHQVDEGKVRVFSEVRKAPAQRL
jgi:hypothetical protein